MTMGIPSTCEPENMRPTLFQGLCHLPRTPSPNIPLLQEILAQCLDMLTSLLIIGMFNDAPVSSIQLLGADGFR